MIQPDPLTQSFNFVLGVNELLCVQPLLNEPLANNRVCRIKPLVGGSTTSLNGIIPHAFGIQMIEWTVCSGSHTHTLPMGSQNQELKMAA